jgi:hypothetical protein
VRSGQDREAEDLLSPMGRVSRSVIAAMVCLTSAVVAGCGAAGTVATPTLATPKPTPTPAPTSATSALVTQFVEVAIPMEAAYSPFYDTYQKLRKTQPSQSQLDDLCKPMFAATQTYIAAVPRLPWPPAMLADVRALLTAAGAFEADMNGPGSPTFYVWGNKMADDSYALGNAANVVYADLHLPPPTSIT